MNFSDWKIQIALMLSAASALIYEIGATHILFFYFIESSYSMATVLGVFLFGLGVGSFLVYRFLEKIRNREMMFGILQLLIAFYVFFVFTQLLKILPHISTLGTFVVSSLILFLPTVFLGAIFPLAGSIFKSREKEVIGLVYSVDLLGAIVGAFIAGFLLIPFFGITFAFLVGAGFNLVSALVILPVRKKLIPAFAGLAFVVMLNANIFDLSYLVSSVAQRYKIQFSEQSPFGEVKIINDTLFIDEREQCSLFYAPGASEREMASYAIEPLRHSHETVEVLNIGLGCGLTLTRVLNYANTRADVVEINPAVVRASQKFTDVLKNERAHLIIDDGLRYLRQNKKKYHSILIDIEHPAVAHSSNLYTVDAFKIIRDSLSKDGTLAIWNYSRSSKANYQSRYLDILYYSLKEAFPFVYTYPGVFLASKEKLQGNEYVPRGSYAINTIDKNTLTPAFLSQ